ncbi:MAG: hypothetical protein KGI72_05375 [Patescibacteria group bacterium]|nr:hypothetical protein [Patescibacteria group bacterium]MDE2233091.1 hypothetical protein [Patescibacteria group bacterium]
MLLLPKNEIRKRQEGDRALEIGEGIKISRKVDALRETRAKSEAEWESYRLKSLEAVKNDINAILEKKRALLDETDELEKKAAAVMSSIRERERRNEEVAGDLAAKTEEAEEKLTGLKESEAHLKKIIEETQGALLKAVVKEKEAARLQDEAARLRRQNLDVLEDTRKAKERFEIERGERERMLADRESLDSLREKTIEEREKENAAQAEKNRKEAIKLADRRKVLERAFARIKK